MESAESIREYLLNRLRLTLCRPGMFGGESAILNLMDIVSFADGRVVEWERHRSELKRVGASRATGVGGGFAGVHGTRGANRHEHGVASVYAEIAHAMGYLELGVEHGVQRLLELDEYQELVQTRCTAATIRDWTPDEVIGLAGLPSLRWGSSRHYPWTLSYFVTGQADLFVHFDFWVEWQEAESGERVPGKLREDPTLRNVRLPADAFTEQFVFSPLGRSLREGGAAEGWVQPKDRP